MSYGLTIATCVVFIRDCTPSRLECFGVHIHLISSFGLILIAEEELRFGACVGVCFGLSCVPMCAMRQSRGNFYSRSRCFGFFWLFWISGFTKDKTSHFSLPTCQVAIFIDCDVQGQIPRHSLTPLLLASECSRTCLRS